MKSHADGRQTEMIRDCGLRGFGETGVTQQRLRLERN